MIKALRIFHTKTNLIVISLLLTISLIWRVSASATHTSFSQDAARDVWLTKQLALNNEWIVAYGPKTSIGNFNLPPLYNQMHLIFATITNHHPLTMKWVITVLESLTPVMLYLILKRIAKPELAILGSIIYLFSVQPSVFGTTAWNPNLIPLLATTTLYGAIKVLVDKSHSWILVICVTASWAMQLHFQAAVLLPFMISIFLISVWKRRSWQTLGYWFGGGLLAFLFISPYLWAEINSNWYNSRQMLVFFTTEHSQYYDRISKPAYVVTFFPKFLERVTFGFELYKNVIGYLLYIFGFIYLGLTVIKKRSLPHVLVIFYLLSIMISLRIFKGDKHDYYLSLLFPMASILLVSAVSSIKKSKIGVSVLLIIIFMIGVKQSFWQPTNDVHELQKSIEMLEQVSPSQNIRLLFHDADLINTLFYGLNEYSDLVVDQTSPVVVDVCLSKEICRWDFSPRSQHSLEYTLIGDYKLATGYEPLYSIAGSNLTLWVGQVSHPEIEFNYSKLRDNSAAGSDKLLKL